jgi:hypothetical protein
MTTPQKSVKINVVSHVKKYACPSSYPHSRKLLANLVVNNALVCQIQKLEVVLIVDRDECTEKADKVVENEI